MHCKAVEPAFTSTTADGEGTLHPAGTAGPDSGWPIAGIIYNYRAQQDRDRPGRRLGFVLGAVQKCLAAGMCFGGCEEWAVTTRRTLKYGAARQLGTEQERNEIKALLRPKQLGRTSARRHDAAAPRRAAMRQHCVGPTIAAAWPRKGRRTKAAALGNRTAYRRAASLGEGEAPSGLPRAPTRL